MKRNNTFRRLTATAFCLLFMVLCLPGPASAYTRIDTAKDASLTLVYGEENSALSGAAFRLYRVAGVSETVGYTLTGDFTDYAVSLEDLDSAGWLNLAGTLAAYAARDELAPLAEGVTDETGTLSLDSLEVGLYLVVGDPLTVGSYTYTPTPFLISLPNLNEADEWEYDVTACPKYSEEYHGGGSSGTTVQRKVMKVWDDGGSTQRPSEVEVQLLRSGQVYATVTLNEDNGWTYTWTGLSTRYQWQVVEKTVPEDYTVSVALEGSTFVVTNTYEEPEDPNVPVEPIEPTDPGTPVEPSNPVDPGTPAEPSDPDVTDDPLLPQTGQLWWPVPVLALCGMVSFFFGWLRYRSSSHED